MATKAVVAFRKCLLLSDNLVDEQTLPSVMLLWHKKKGPKENRGQNVKMLQMRLI